MTLDFGAWLLKQDHRRDSVGELAWLLRGSAPRKYRQLRLLLIQHGQKDQLPVLERALAQWDGEVAQHEEQPSTHYVALWADAADPKDAMIEAPGTQGDAVGVARQRAWLSNYRLRTAVYRVEWRQGQWWTRGRPIWRSDVEGRSRRVARPV